MTPQDYIKKALRTSPDSYDFKETNGVSPQLEHSVIGMSSEIGEVVDIIKKAKIYGKKLDQNKLKEEIGDALWYIALFLDSVDSSFEEVWEKNIEKLKKRYPVKFTKDDALERKDENIKSSNLKSDANEEQLTIT
jgi:NTP pyrophosphatase (non-canonical NTP hydrolase)